MSDHENRLDLIIGRGRILLVDDTGTVQRLQVDLGPTDTDGSSLQIIDQVPMVGSFGLYANPPAGSDVITLHIGGRRTMVVGVGHNSQAFRLVGLNPGEVALKDQWDNLVKLTEAGIEIVHSSQVTITAPTIALDGTVSVTGDVEVSGSMTVGGTVTAAGFVP